MKHAVLLFVFCVGAANAAPGDAADPTLDRALKNCPPGATDLVPDPRFAPAEKSKTTVSESAFVVRVSGDDTVPVQVQEYPVACVAQVTEVKKEDWSLAKHDGSPLAHGSYTIAFRFLEPATYAGKLRRMCVYEEKDLKIEGRMLNPGDVISFAAFHCFLDQAVEPDVFSNLQQVSLRKKPEANQAAEPTRTTVTPPAGAGDRASGARGSP
jgi:hypothetical protein